MSVTGRFTGPLTGAARHKALFLTAAPARAYGPGPAFHACYDFCPQLGWLLHALTR
ncbi:hypothetical protein [Streptomyces maremycinicus]|uniref:hypothetical protein n=1 Tax=Streptomyces maremycinicus TaxID=1679753 RepID=UPI000A4B3FA7|nr:hypothetical protein [Streptomyces sp. NBRC 110468]